MNRFTYTRVGAYWIPELKLMEQSLHPIGKYGRMRRRYLKECRPMLYSHLILTARLHPHLVETDEAANRRMELLMPKLAKGCRRDRAAESQRSHGMGGKDECIEGSGGGNHPA